MFLPHFIGAGQLLNNTIVQAPAPLFHKHPYLMFHVKQN